MLLGIIYGGKGAEELSNYIALHQIIHVLDKYSLSYKAIYLNRNDLSIADLLDIDIFFVIDSNCENKENRKLVFDYVINNNVPIIGQSQKAILLARNKYLSNKRFSKRKILVPKSFTVDCYYNKDIAAKTHNLIVKNKIIYPLIIKDNYGSSSENVFYCQNDSQLKLAITLINATCKKILVEEYIQGTEMTVPYVQLFGKKIALNPVEITYDGPIYDHKIKNRTSKFKSIVRKDLPPGMLSKIRDVTLTANLIIGSRYYSRLDIKIRNNDIVIIEINGEPTLCINDFMTKSARSLGLSYPKFIIGLFSNSKLFTDYAKKYNFKLYKLIRIGKKIVNKYI